MHRPGIEVVREGVEMASRRPPQHRDQRPFGELGDIADGSVPAVPELGRCHRPDAPEPLDRERVEKRELAAPRHHEQAVGLGDAARHLGEELRPGDADGDRQADPLENVSAQPHRDLGRRPGEPAHPAHVEERLVDREALDQRGRVLEHLEHRLARLDVGREPRLDDDRVRAEAARLPAAHRGADPERLGLVARREHDAAAHDHGAAAQAGIVALLDRREERIEVGVENRRLRHERMFA